MAENNLLGTLNWHSSSTINPSMSMIAQIFMKLPDSFLSHDIKSELDRQDVLLNKVHVTKDIHNLSDLENQALLKLKNRDDIMSKS